MKRYIITGTWSFVCEADTECNAMEQFDLSSLEDIDICTDYINIEIEEIEA